MMRSGDNWDTVRLERMIRSNNRGMKERTTLFPNQVALKRISNLNSLRVEGINTLDLWVSSQFSQKEFVATLGRGQENLR